MAIQGIAGIMPRANGHDYALIPAAGKSRRMGCHKLLLPWPTTQRPDGLVIDAVLAAWTESRVKDTVIVIRSDDQPLLTACRAWPVLIVRPEDAPRDMKESVQLGVRYLETERLAGDRDRCFVSPADLPELTSDLIDKLLFATRDVSKIVVPTFEQEKDNPKMGHPALIPWSILGEIFCLDDDEGVNRIVDRHQKHTVAFPGEMAFDDIDTPSQYEAARRREG